MDEKYLDNLEMQVPETIPFFAHESAMARMERQIKRLWIALLIAIVALFASNIAWLYYESQFVTISYEQDGEGLNNINTGKQGDVFGAESAREAQEKGVE